MNRVSAAWCITTHADAVVDTHEIISSASTRVRLVVPCNVKIEILRADAVRGANIEGVKVEILEVSYGSEGDIVDVGLMMTMMLYWSIFKVNLPIRTKVSELRLQCSIDTLTS